jgi:hypothetical protein
MVQIMVTEKESDYIDHGFIAGTLVNTRDGLKPIERIKAGDWVLSRPEDPAQGTETGYKRVTKTFRFENKAVVALWWTRSDDAETAKPDIAYVTPNHPTWLNAHGAWEPIGGLRWSTGAEEWLDRELVLADGTYGAYGEVTDLYRTDKPEVAFEDDGWGSCLGKLIDLSGPEPKVVGRDLLYDYEAWSDPKEETLKRYTTTVYNLEVEDWHTYFVGRTGLWVHNTNCFDPVLEVVPGKPA